MYGPDNLWQAPGGERPHSSNQPLGMPTTRRLPAATAAMPLPFGLRVMGPKPTYGPTSSRRVPVGGQPRSLKRTPTMQPRLRSRLMGLAMPCPSGRKATVPATTSGPMNLDNPGEAALAPVRPGGGRLRLGELGRARAARGAAIGRSPPTSDEGVGPVPYCENAFTPFSSM